MHTIEITVYRPCAGTRARDQLGRSYRGQAGLLRENIDALNHPLVTIDVPDAPPKLWYPVILCLLPEDAIRFRVVENPGVPGAEKRTAVPWTWLVREGAPWPAEPGPLPANHSLREAQMAQYASHPPTFGGPVFHDEAERLLYVSEDWGTYRTRDFAGNPDPRFPHYHLGPTSLETVP